MTPSDRAGREGLPDHSPVKPPLADIAESLGQILQRCRARWDQKDIGDCVRNLLHAIDPKNPYLTPPKGFTDTRSDGGGAGEGTYPPGLSVEEAEAGPPDAGDETEDRRLSLDAIDEAIEYCERKGGKSIALRLITAREHFASQPTRQDEARVGRVADVIEAARNAAGCLASENMHRPSHTFGKLEKLFMALEAYDAALAARTTGGEAQ